MKTIDKIKILMPIILPFIALIAWAAKVDNNLTKMESKSSVIESIDKRLYRIELKLGIEK